MKRSNIAAVAANEAPSLDLNGEANGGRFTVNGGGLGAAETMVIDGSAETGASLRLFGGAGADTLTGGGGADLIVGGLGADTVSGGAGADVFRCQRVEDSTDEAPDTIVAFLSGTEKVDLGRIDTDPLPRETRSLISSAAPPSPAGPASCASTIMRRWRAGRPRSISTAMRLPTSASISPRPKC